MPLDDLQCRLCSCSVDQPVQASCRKLVCSACIVSLLNLRSCDLASFLCPFCKESHEITATSFPAATEVTMTVLGDLFLTCNALYSHPMHTYCIRLYRRVASGNWNVGGARSAGARAYFFYVTKFLRIQCTRETAVYTASLV